MIPNIHEVAGHPWIPLSHFHPNLNPNLIIKIPRPAASLLLENTLNFQGWKRHLLILGSVIFGNVNYHGITLPGSTKDVKDISLVLWGLTLWMTSDLLNLTKSISQMKGYDYHSSSTTISMKTIPTFQHWDMNLLMKIFRYFGYQK